jgi:hypothetical protein
MPSSGLTNLVFRRCEAVGQDRDLVRCLLLELYSQLRIRNILRAVALLENRWENLDRSRDILRGPIDLSKESGADGGDVEFVDFIPY